MRVATFNILSGRSPGDGRADLDRFRRAVRHLDADLLGLQEVDRRQPRSRQADLTAVAAEAMGASYRLFAASLIGTPGLGRPGIQTATGLSSPMSTDIVSPLPRSSTTTRALPVRHVKRSDCPRSW